jgi:hypothetical protein
MPTNTCALRISYDLNRAGFTIKGSGLTSTGADGSKYYLKIAALTSFLTTTFGPPQSLSAGQFNGPSSKTGIIYFKIPFEDATGHVTLWTGQDVIDRSEEQYGRWPAPRSALFWEVK